MVIIGGGLIGSETALDLAQKGKKVTIVEILDRVLRDMYLANRMHLLKLLNDFKVEILTGTTASEITSEGVVILDKNGKKSMLLADNIILAVGMKPSTKLLDGLRDQISEVHSVGDCVEPRRVINAIHEREQANEILARIIQLAIVLLFGFI